MPNWTMNQVTAKEDFDFLAHDLYSRDDSGRLQFDFNKLVPMPEELNMTEGGVTDEALMFYLTERCELSPRNLTAGQKEILQRRNLSKDRILSLYKDLQLGLMKKNIHYNLYEKGKQYAYNLQNHKFATWYGWCCKNWGTKWNACETDVSSDCLSFWTAWSEPIPIMKALSKKFPDITFEMYCEYEGCSLVSYFKFAGGEMFDRVDDHTDPDYDYASE